jgi:ribosomal protein S6--L-glutamate ligase/gamma-F420-2:alpha-L-glutamate ligase
LGVQADVLANDFFPTSIGEDGEVCLDLPAYDFCIYLDKDKYVPYLLEKRGLRLFNSARAVEQCDDKMTTAICLADAGVPMPLTLPGLLCFDPDAPIADALFAKVERRLGYPFVLKTSFGSLGKGVYKITDRAAFVEAENRVKCQPHLYQRFVAASEGHDVRVIVIGGEVVAAMERRSAVDFRSNIELGGIAKPYNVPPVLATMCQKVARLLDLDYCGIDVLVDGERYLLCEVNSNAFFGGIERTTGVNVAKRYADYIYRTIYGAVED